MNWIGVNYFKMRPILFFVFLSVLLACNTSPHPPQADAYLKLAGETMGTTYHITYQGKALEAVKAAIEKTLKSVNEGASTYEPKSVISLFNQSEDSLDLRLLDESHSKESIQHFKINLIEAKRIYEQTDGFFDATVMPLVNYWGFGYTGREAVEKRDAKKIEALLDLVGLDKVDLRGEVVYKMNKAVQLDFSAIAKGYGVDAVASVLERFGSENYIVEIGGETVVKGVNSRGQNWTLGINVPDTKASTRAIFQKVQFTNQGLATSGDYRNYFEVNGRKYGHSINPKSGMPESELLSVSVLAPNCMVADAYATAFMVMGLDKALPLAERLPAVEAYFIYQSNSKMVTSSTAGFSQYLID